MGQYHLLVNLSKREFVDPHRLGVGLKLAEQMSFPLTAVALYASLPCSNGRGGGDLRDHPWIGRWAGDRIAVVGDYALEEDLPGAHTAYSNCRAGVFKDVSDLAADFISKFYRISIGGKEGWKSVACSRCGGEIRFEVYCRYCDAERVLTS